MNALIKKEIRLLLPTWLTGLAVAFLFLFVKRDYNYVSGFQTVLTLFPFFLITGLVLMMALDSFGREMSAGTFSNLLAQPVSRVRIWRTKTLLLALAILAICLVLWFALLNNSNIKFGPREIQEALGFTAVFAMAIYSGGLWAVLLLRQVAAAFWVTILVPLALMISIIYLEQKFPGVTEPAVIIVLCLYSLAGFLFARWLFLRAQDVQWTGGVIALPEIFGRTRSRIASSTQRTWRPRRALFIKEIQLHQSQLVIAGVLLLLHLVVIATRYFGDFKDSPTIEFVLNGFGVLWFIMPLVVGSAAVAEERRLGTLEAQLCLPVRRRTQFGIKLASAIMLSLLLGVAVPLLLEGDRLIPEFHPKFLNALSEYFLKREDILDYAIASAFAFVHFSAPILILIGIASVIAAVSFYASTLSRNTLQSLAPAVLGIMVAFTLLRVAPFVGQIFPFLLWRGGLIYLIGIPIVTLMLFALMYSNFKRVWIDWKVWWRNAVVFATTLAIVTSATSGIYHRVWELFIPLEPAHGPARLTSPESVTMQSYRETTTIRLPNGQIWIGGFVPFASDLKTMLSGDWEMKPVRGNGDFVLGTNWADVAVSFEGMVGIHNDGSLWASEKLRESPKSQMTEPMRIGRENDWKSVAGNFFSAFLLKQNGTLWRFKTEGWNQKKPWPGIQTFELVPLGTNTDWASFSRIGGRTVFWKADGHAWSVEPSLGAERITLDDKTILYRAEHLDGLKSGTHAWSRSFRSGNFFVGVREDGKFVVSGDFEKRRIRHDEIGIQLGKESDWLTVVGWGETVVTLKADGSLWKWTFGHDPVKNPDSASAVRLSKHFDWIAIGDSFGSVISLAADGSLWFWQLDNRKFLPSESVIDPLLSASRKPQRIGNIFDAPPR